VVPYEANWRPHGYVDKTAAGSTPWSARPPADLVAQGSGDFSHKKSSGLFPSTRIYVRRNTFTP
jgi:hypothetical protein